MRSNLEHWKHLQDSRYFENHPCYGGLKEFGGGFECVAIEWFLPLTLTMKIVVIGCGYGRETASIAKRVGHVYGIDVSDTILAKAKRFLAERGIGNVTLVRADNYRSEIPRGIDLVFSMIVMQHLTRSLVTDYFISLGKLLRPGGSMVIQFLEEFPLGMFDAELRDYEPSVTWTVPQLVELSKTANLGLREVRTFVATPSSLWHWCHFEKQQ